MRLLTWVALAALPATACGDDHGAVDGRPGIDAATDAGGPDARITFDTLQETGLCADAACTATPPGVLAFTPQFVLWSDGATKKRWIDLPDGAQIDTADMDYWRFPVGTKVWKEFTRDGTRVETRMLQKVGPTDDDWFLVAYVWNAAQDEAVAMPAGVRDVLGTQHDVPSRAECRQCHDRTDGEVLGFSAIELDYDAPTGQVDLDDLVAMNALTDPPGGTTPRFPVPGAPAERAMLGYAHANCGHCHNPTSDVFRDITNMDLRLRVATLGTVGDTPLYTTTINVAAVPPVNGATLRVHPQNLDDSVLYQRFVTTTAAQHMPKIGTEITDPTGQTIIEDWIGALPP